MAQIKGYDSYITDNPFHNEKDPETFIFEHIEPIDINTVHPGCTPPDIKIILTAGLEHILFNLKIGCKGHNEFINAHITGWYIDRSEQDIKNEINEIIINEIQN